MDFSLYKKTISQLSTSDNITLNTAANLKVEVPALDFGETSETVKFTIINKNISTPIGMKNLIVQGDKLSRRILFETNRYFDGVDLSTKKFFINFVNAKNQSGTDDIIDLYITDTLITFEWWIPAELTVLDGEVTIQLEIVDFNEDGDIAYRFMTTTLPIKVQKTIVPNGEIDQNDYYLDIRFLNEYTNDITYNMASEIDAIKIDGRTIVMPYLEDLVVTQDSRSKILTFVIDRYFDNVDFADKTIAIKFELPDGQGDRSFVCNTVVSDTKIRFDWLLDSRVTLMEGAVTFSIEFIGYNEKNEFTCWNTLTSTLFVSKGLDVDSKIEQPSATWIQSWNILADKYLKNFLKYMNMVEELSERLNTVIAEVEESCKKAEASASTSKVWSDIAWNQADRADQVKTEILILKADFDNKKVDFDKKYKNFINELPNLRKKSDKIEYDDLDTALATYIDGKSDKDHSHDASEIYNARSKKDPITEDDLSMDLLDKINSGGGTGGGGGSGSSISLSSIFNDDVISSNKGWTSNKINSEINTVKENYVQKNGKKSLSDNNFTDYYRKKLDSIEENANYFDVSELAKTPISLFKQDPLHRTVTDAQIETFKDKYTKTEVDNLIASISTGLSWKDPVATYNSLLSTYPKPSNGDTVNVTNDPTESKNGTYTYNEDTGKWVQISSSSVPLATTSSNGLMSKDDKALLNSLKEFVDNYEEPDVTTETIDTLKKEINTTLESYRNNETLITEEDIDPSLIEKLSVADSSLIDDASANASNTWSSAKILGAIEDAIDNAMTDINNSTITEDDVSSWFSEIDEEFAWSNYE